MTSTTDSGVFDSVEAMRLRTVLRGESLDDRDITVRIPAKHAQLLAAIVVVCDAEPLDPGSHKARRRVGDWVRECVNQALRAGYRHPDDLMFMPPPSTQSGGW